MHKESHVMDNFQHCMCKEKRSKKRRGLKKAQHNLKHTYKGNEVINFYSYLEWEGEIMATQSCSEGTKAPLTVTLTYSSSERWELKLTFTWR